MNCPYCNEKIEKGFIQSAQELSWKNKKSFINKASLNPGSIMLSEFSILKGSAIISYCCRRCEKITIDFENQKCDYNQNGAS